MTRVGFAYAELDARRREDARFPVAPDPSSPDWAEYARTRRNRARRRKAMGYSRAAANDLVAWAAAQEMAIAA
jgi:hypothetical protein